MQRQINQEELTVFYHEIGAAVWLIQYLEDILVKYLVAKRLKGQPITESDASLLLEKERKRTLGAKYKSAKIEGIIPTNLEGRFDKLLEERNWLIHESWYESGSNLYNDTMRERMIYRISQIQEETVQLQQLMFNEFISFFKTAGCDVDLAFRMGKEKIRKLKGI